MKKSPISKTATSSVLPHPAVPQSLPRCNLLPSQSSLTTNDRTEHTNAHQAHSSHHTSLAQESEGPLTQRSNKEKHNVMFENGLPAAHNHSHSLKNAHSVVLPPGQQNYQYPQGYSSA
ncbi:MAG: hypothetical protein ACREOZ_01455, partial [Gloeomargaritales cyanobacterium]